MGKLVYASTAQFEFDDRVLSHVKVAVGAKLRRQESFYLSWTVPSSEGSGRRSLWVSPSIALEFHFHSARAPEINRVWVHALDLSASGDRGMIVMSEADAEAYVEDRTKAPRTGS